MVQCQYNEQMTSTCIIFFPLHVQFSLVIPPPFVFPIFGGIKGLAIYRGALLCHEIRDRTLYVQLINIKEVPVRYSELYYMLSNE